MYKLNEDIILSFISFQVNGLAFSSNGTTFVTIGVRHVKYWFLDESKRKVCTYVHVLADLERLFIICMK